MSIIGFDEFVMMGSPLFSLINSVLPRPDESPEDKPEDPLIKWVSLCIVVVVIPEEIPPIPVFKPDDIPVCEPDNKPVC